MVTTVELVTSASDEDENKERTPVLPEAPCSDQCELASELAEVK